MLDDKTKPMFISRKNNVLTPTSGTLRVLLGFGDVSFICIHLSDTVLYDTRNSPILKIIWRSRSKDLDSC